MGGSSQTTGWNYRLAWLHMLGMGPWDTFREFRGADKTIWKGRITGNTALALRAPMLWGGDKDQGGVDGTLRLMFGEAGQLPNGYCAAIFGPRTAAYRGFMTAAWEGGIWGANNPWAQKCSYRGERYIKGWDNDDCWYPQTCPVPLTGGSPGSGGLAPRFLAFSGDSIVRPLADEFLGDDDTIVYPGSLNIRGGARFGNEVILIGEHGSFRAGIESLTAWSAGPSISIGFYGGQAVKVAGGRLWVACGAAGVAYIESAADAAFEVISEFGGTTIVDVAGTHDFMLAFGMYGGVWRSEGNGAFAQVNNLFEVDHPPNLFFISAADEGGGLVVVAGYNSEGKLSVKSSTNRGDTFDACTVPPGISPAIHVRCCGDYWLIASGSPSGGMLHSSDGHIFESVPSLAGVDFSECCVDIDIDRGRAVAVGYAGGNLHWYESSDGWLWTEFDGSDTAASKVIGLFLEATPTPPTLGRFAKNPAHMILERHTQQHSGRQPRSSVNLEHLALAADWFFSRGFGLCTTRNSKEESPREFIKRIEKVAGCSFTKSLDDGKWYLDIANGVYDLDSLPVITDDEVLEFKETTSTLDNVVNSVSVKYFDPERKETIITPPVRAMGLIAQFGEIHQTFEFPEVPIGRIALEIATRELLARTTPKRTFELKCNPSIYRLRKNQYVRVQLLKRGIADMVCVIGEIPTSGKLKSGAFQITLTQDVYSLPTTEYLVELGEDTRPPAEPIEIVDKAAFEAAYIDVVANMRPADFEALPADAGYVLAAASNPGRMRNFTMLVAPDGGEYDEVDEGEFCPSCALTGAIEPGLQEDIGYTAGSNMAAVRVGSVGTLNGELVRVDAVDLDAQTINLGRGCGDTLPRKHAAGDVILFYQVANAYDRTQHIAGETLQVKLLTNSFSQQMDEDDAEAVDVDVVGRIGLPYIAGNFTINGVSIYSVGTPTPGGGGGGPGGGGPTTPPATGPNGAPASQTPGPNGGYPDDAPPLYPLPEVFDVDVIGPAGTFADPSNINNWRNRDGSPLGPEWSIVDGKLHFRGGGGAPTREAYGYAWRRGMPYMPFPRLTLTSAGDVFAEPGCLGSIGIAYGTYQTAHLPSYVDASTPAEYLVETHVEHAFEHVIYSAAPGAGYVGEYPVINYMPVVQVAVGDSTVNASFDNIELTIQEFVPATVAETGTNDDFSAGLAGWSLYPDPADTNPYMADISVAGGVLIADFVSEYGTSRWVIQDAPLTHADTIGKFVHAVGKGWSNDAHIQATALGQYPSGGVVWGLAYKHPDGSIATDAGGRIQRGDFTERETWQPVRIAASSGVTTHRAICLSGKPGTRAMVKDLVYATTVGVYPEPTP